MALTKLITDLIDGSLGTDWQATPKTANFIAVAGEGYFVNTTSAAITVTLPSSPTAGDEVSIVDYAGTADTNNITITSSDNINGSSDDVKINYERGGVSMVYVDATQGWIAYNAANETAGALAPNIIEVDYLVVAGGGGTPGDLSGGGGAGGLRTSYTNTSNLNGHTETALTLTALTNYTITVGAGGAGTAYNVSGVPGENSVFNNITSTGGGNGATLGASISAGDGGSGGGARSNNTPGAAITSPVTQGYAGGNFSTNNVLYSGGGGGAAQLGENGVGGTRSGNGGLGLEVNIIGGTNNFYAGGGGAGGYAGGGIAGGTGGSGGGGNGGGSGTTMTNGVSNTGGGAGGQRDGANSGSSGGSGIVILRYPDAYTISETTSPTVLSFTTDDTTVSGYKITTFTAGENGTIQFS